MKPANFRLNFRTFLFIATVISIALFLPLTHAIAKSSDSHSSSHEASSSHDKHASSSHAPSSHVVSSHDAPDSHGGHGDDGHHSGELNLGYEVEHHLTDIHNIELPNIHHWGKSYSLDHLKFEVAGIDMSITKPVIFMWIAGLVLILSFTLGFRGGKLMRNKYAHLLEVYILFIRDEVVYPNLGEEEGRKLLPFFLTIFFFILMCNLLGMLPFGNTATANVNVTAGLAIIALMMIQGMGIVKNGFFGHFKSALFPPGLPLPIYIIIAPIEVVGIIAKPFALCIRLFANMVAGHAVILVLLMLILVSGSFVIAPFPILGVLFISMLELFVAHLQAFIFTILTTLFVSMTMHPQH